MADGFICAEFCLDESRISRLARSVAESLGPGDIVCLAGPLGAGKTTLARAIIRALLHDDGLVVPSPTFTLVQPYALNGSMLFHIDLYRLEATEAFEELGLDDEKDKAIFLVEWPDILPSDWKSDALQIHIDTGMDAQRHYVLSGSRRWVDCFQEIKA